MGFFVDDTCVNYAWNFDALHSFDIICNADDVQT